MKNLIFKSRFLVLFIGLLTMCVTQLLATEVSLTQAEIKSATAQGSYANCSVESTSGTWAGKMIINTKTGYVQINQKNDNYYLGSPTFSGGVTKVVITTCNSTASGRMFYLCANTNTAQPNSGIYGSGSTSSSNGTATITVTGSPTSFYIYSNGAAYISSVTVTYSGNSPSITKSGTLTAFTATYGSASDEQNFTVGGSKLTADISVTAPANYEISKTSGSGFGSSVTLTKDGSGNVTNTTLYIRLKDNIDAGSVDATTITCTSAGATDQTISIPASKVQSKVNWSVNGSAAAGSPTLAVDKAGKVSALPTDPTSPDCDGSKVFVGWTDTIIASETDTKPSTLFTVASSAPTVNANDVTYYAVFATQSGGGEPVETKTQTLVYDTWTYSGSTTDKSSYRLFHSGSYIESASFDRSKLSKVIVYGGTFGGASYNKLTIGDGTNTWESVTVSGKSETGVNTFTDGNELSGTGKIRITSNSGSNSGSETGVRISKVEIFTMEGGSTYTND